jgi:NAD(P)H-nitrite reductase large subunit
MRTFLLLVFTSLISTTFASLPSGDVTCGDNVYTVDEIVAAINAGVEDLDDDNLQGTLESSYVCGRY